MTSVMISTSVMIKCFDKKWSKKSNGKYEYPFALFLGCLHNLFTKLGQWTRRIGSLKNNILSKENNISSGLFPIVLRYIYSSRVPLN